MQRNAPFFQAALNPQVYHSEIRQEGFHTHFRDGKVYRFSGIVPLLEFSSAHNEMGLQYRVLISPEIKIACETFERIFAWMAEQMGNSLSNFYEMIRRQTLLLLKKLWQCFVQEIQPGNLFQCDQTVTFFVLSTAWGQFNPQKALQELLAELNVEDHFLQTLVPLIERRG